MNKFKFLVFLTILTASFAFGLQLMEIQSYSDINAVSGKLEPLIIKQEISLPVLGPILPTSTPASLSLPQPNPEVKTNTKIYTKPKAVAQPTAKAKVTPTLNPITSPAISNCKGSLAEEFLCLLNQYRSSKNLGVVTGSSKLSSVALSHSQWMNDTSIFSHTGADGSRLSDRCKAAGTTCLGENLAKDAKSAQNLLDMWKVSPKHNANLLGKYSIIGFGMSGTYITLLLN